jgi:mono/diheme cytochrome c family protein
MVVLVGAFLFYKSQAGKNEYGKNSLPELNEQGEKLWADADRNIQAQTFTIDAAKDTVIETKGGIVMAIPSNCFLDENGNIVEGKVDLAVKEALDPATMINAGLSTRSGDELLESGGMFFTDARKDGKILKINPAKGIYTEIPSNEIKPGMQLFSGKRMANGTIDWIDPKPLEHDLLPVDIKTLNFYPLDYLDSLTHWGYDIKNKAFTDSLYYSFASGFGQQPATVAIKDNEVPIIQYEAPMMTDSAARLDGRTLFFTKCASCHNPLQESTGPSLKGVLNNDYYKGDISKVARWINNVVSLTASERHYQELLKRYGSNMTQFDNMPETEVAAIFDYIESYQIDVGVKVDTAVFDCGINPAKIKAIWNEQFQNTFIATREFEERLKAIHNYSNPAILDLYLNNLNKPLYYVDSLASLISKEGGGGDASHSFGDFAARRDGRVKTGSVQFEMLKKYYEDKTRAYTEAITKTQNEYWNKQVENDIEASNKKFEHTMDSNRRMWENYQQELDLNMKDAYRQLGKDPNIPRGVPSNVYSAQVTTTGWCNVDRYVIESTITRTTLDYTDPENGKKAVIKYEPVSIEISQWNEYDRLYVYLLPSKLSSFMRLDGTDGKYSEKLNELMQYDLVCIAYKDEQAYYYSQKDIRPGSYPAISLTMMEKDELDQRLNNFGQSQAAELKKEKDYFFFEILDAKRQKHNMALQELTEKIRPVIFSCSRWPLYSDIKSETSNPRFAK